MGFWEWLARREVRRAGVNPVSPEKSEPPARPRHYPPDWEALDRRVSPPPVLPPKELSRTCHCPYCGKRWREEA